MALEKCVALTHWAAPILDTSTEPGIWYQDLAQQDPAGQERKEEHSHLVLAISFHLFDEPVSGGGMSPPSDDYKAHQELLEGCLKSGHTGGGSERILKPPG